MKFYQKMLRLILLIDLVLLVFVAVSFQVDDMTLSKGEAFPFDEGWSMTWPDGRSVDLMDIPYMGESLPEETVVLENTVPKEYFGMTMAFLSADKTLKVWMDDQLVYQFGVDDQRAFGHTPGSIYNFIDVPHNLKEGNIRIEMTSPYHDYAARISSITVGERDVLILKLLKDNIFEIGCNLIILICGLMFFLLFLIRLASRQDGGGMQYLCGYCIVASLYYFVETKVLHIFYGNQTFYSFLVFLCLMMIPFFVGMYYANGKLGVYKLRWRILLGLVCINIVMQFVLQLTNVVDFMNMVVFSHALIALSILVVAKSYLDALKEEKEKEDKWNFLEMVALFFMGIGGTMDIVRMYVVGVGDMGKFSRLGTTCFSIIMLYRHFSQMIKGYAGKVEENARLLKHEMEYMEKETEQLKKAKELAEEARQDAIAANAAKDKFLAHMSHEIRTPINAVLGMDTMILRETQDMKIKEYALDIQNAGQNLLAIINDILDFSKIESGKLELIMVEYDFSSMIHDISNMIKTKAQAKNLELKILVDESIPSKLLGDDVRIRQILVNLLNNAVKYTHQGTVALHVSGRTEGRKEILEFSVQDTGIGIREEDISKLFEEFERIEEKRNRNIEGTGLGINITTQLLLLMGSRLQVESTYGKGSRFYFTLEQQIVDSTPIGNLEARIREQSTEYSYAPAFTAPKAQILLVDDNLMNLKVLVSLLKPVQIKVDVAESGKTCLEMVGKKHYDLIFLDHMMPGMDGIETLHRMKEMETNLCEGSPVVALTANAITGAKEMYLSEGFDAFLPKPINPEKLEQMILKLLPRDLLQFDLSTEAEKEANEQPVVSGRIHLLQDTDLPMVDGIDWSYGAMHLPDKELLLNTVEDFYKTLEMEADTLEDYYLKSKSDPEMLTQYRIKVHAMKSSANLIGAIMLGGMAKLLENAATNGDFMVLDALHDIFVEEWRSYKEKLEVCIQTPEEDRHTKPLTAEELPMIPGLLDTLKNAMDELDIDVADGIMEKLRGFSYPPKVQENIEKLGAFVTNLDCEQAELLINELTDQINHLKLEE